MAARPLTFRNVAGYSRVSVETEESVSIMGQTRMIEAECKRRGWPEPVIFTDSGVSGSKAIARPARDDLERRIEAGEFDALLVKSVDRLARSVADFFRIVATAKKAGCAVIVIEAGLDTSTPIGEMIVGILAQFAQFEAATIAQRVTVSLDNRRREGRALGGPKPYGLRNVKHDDRAGMWRDVDPEEAPVVRRMVEEVLAGHSLRAIAKGLTDDGIPTPRRADAAKRTEGDAEAGAWSFTTVKRIVTNPAIAGMERTKGDVVRGEDGLARVQEDAQIIDAETFRAVLAVIEGRSGAAAPRRPLEDRPLLDGLAKCAGCGSAMVQTGSRAGRGGKTYVNLRCAGYADGRCTAPATVSMPALDEHVVGTFLDALGDTERTRLEAVEDESLSAKVIEVRAEIAATTVQFGTAASGDLAGLAERMGALRETEARLLAQQGSAPLYVVTGTGTTWREAWTSASTVTARREVLAEALDRVLVRKSAERGKREPVGDRVEIIWGGEQQAA